MGKRGVENEVKHWEAMWGEETRGGNKSLGAGGGGKEVFWACLEGCEMRGSQERREGGVQRSVMKFKGGLE